MNRVNLDDRYGVFIPSNKKPLMTGNDLRVFEVFIAEGCKRRLFNLHTGEGITQCGGLSSETISSYTTK